MPYRPECCNVCSKQQRRRRRCGVEVNKGPLIAPGAVSFFFAFSGECWFIVIVGGGSGGGCDVVASREHKRPNVKVVCR